MVCYESVWNDVNISGEPPPPYSPPPSASDCFGIKASDKYIYPLNHGPHSAFSPPLQRHPGAMRSNPPPPPYSLMPRSHPQHMSNIMNVPIKSMEKKASAVCSNPIRHGGPISKSGKSLNIYGHPNMGRHSRTTSHHHPDLKTSSQGIECKIKPHQPKLAYIGIASKSDKQAQTPLITGSGSLKRGVLEYKDVSPRHSRSHKMNEDHSRSQNLGSNRCHVLPEGLGAHNRLKETHSLVGPLKLSGSEDHSRSQNLGSNRCHVLPEELGAHNRLKETHSLVGPLKLSGSRLRSGGSMDELSELLDEDYRRSLVFGSSRSLDNLTEPLYENVPTYKTESLGISDIRYGSSNERVIREQNINNIRLQHREQSTDDNPCSEMDDIKVQLQKLQEIASVLGIRMQKGELPSSPSTEPSSLKRLRSAFSLIDKTLQSSSNLSHDGFIPPGVPARAPVIQDVVKRDSKGGKISRLTSFPTSNSRVTNGGLEAYSTSSHSPEADCVSQESGYCSVDSRIYPSGGKKGRDADTRTNSQTDHSLVSYQNMSTHCGSSQSALTQRPEFQNGMIDIRKNGSCQFRSLLRNNVPRDVGSAEGITKTVSTRLSVPHFICNSYTRKEKLQPSEAVAELLKKGENQDQLGIYIKSVVPGGAAHQDGRLQAGDQLLSVDGKSLVGISQEEAAQYMVGTGPIVSLEVARQGALYHGLAPLLSQPSPQDVRGIQDTSILHHIPTNPEIPKQPTHHQPHYPHPQNLKPPQARMQPSKSVPSLHTNDANLSYKASGPLNTSYSRTSSSTSLSQSHCPQRSRSTQNLNEGGPLTLIGRHPSSPSLANDDDRFYQNVSFHQGPQDPRKGSQRGGRPPIFEGNLPLAQHEHRPDVRPMSAFLQREEMTSRDNMHRPTSQQNIRPDPRFSTVIPEDSRRRVERTGPIGFPVVNQTSQSGTNPLKSQNLRVNLKYPANSPGSQNPASSRGTLPSQLSPRGGYPHSPSMVANSPHAFSPQMNPQFINTHNQNTAVKHAPPPTAPKPFRDSGNFGPDAPEKPSRQFGFDIGPSGPPRPPPPEDGYRESPPPPPPPASTHPLLQPNESVLESNTLSAKSLLAKGVKGPWDRDEKEQYELRKREAARRWRDEQIGALESMERKTLQEEEMMNTLKLEREFQRRAEEAQRLEDDEDDDDEDDDREEVKYDKREGNWSQLISSPSVPHNEDDQNEENPSNKVDEIKRKQEELEAAREAEELLLREAQRRQGEEMRRQQHQQQHQYRASQRLDSLLGSPIKDSQASHVASPSPPDRGSSYSVIQQPYDPIIGPRSRPGDTGTVKKVQFSEPFSPSEAYTYDNNANQEKIREDPNIFIDEAETLLNYTSPNRSNENTPGVIGAQEVYRDPRQRRLLEQAQKAAATRNSGQEKLTFREKMKMFAMETEEGSTPKDKLKHSKAQREIEHSS